MKKFAAYLLSALTAVSLTACGGQQSATTAGSSPAAQTEQAGSEASVQESGSAQGSQGTQESASVQESAGAQESQSAAGDSSSQADASAAQSGGNILIAYFSVPETDGVDTVAGASRVVVDGEVLGNCQYVAQLIQEQTGGDLFRIETVQEYPGSHDPLLEYAYTERAEGARPELASRIENPDSYDVIFLGYPNWNADLPMPLYTFLEQNDFSGKTIIPFTTHGGSGLSRTVQTIQELQPNATVVEDGLSISRNSVPDAEGAVTEWISGLDVPLLVTQ